MEKSKTDYMKSLSDKILQTAMTAFAAQGIKAVRMDDIAHMMGISKRTLYELYETKEQLLVEGCRRYAAQKDVEFQRMNVECKNVMDILYHFYCQKLEDFRRTSPAFYADMEKYPAVIRFLQEDRERSQDHFLAFLQRGVNEGYFRSDINLKLVVILFNSIGEYIMNHRLYQQFSMEDLTDNIILVSLRGFCTDLGIRQLDKFISSDD